MLKNKDILEYFYKKIFSIVKRTIINKKVVKIGFSIKEIEGNFIIKNINENNYKKCLKIGFACGIFLRKLRKIHLFIFQTPIKKII